jgi:hypothetical protein
MNTATYNAREHRLVLEHADSPSDAARFADAIATFADPDHMLVVDLTHVPSVPDAMQVAVDDACRAAEQCGCRVHVWHAAPVSV